MSSWFTKVRKLGQGKAGAGWNQHVNKYQKRAGNRVIRREMKKDTELNHV